MQLIALAFLLAALPARVSTISRTLDAIEKVESGGRTDLVGDGGKAIGPMQIHEIYWRDAVEHRPELAKHGYAAVVDPTYARAVVLAYLTRYHATGPESMARMHNGGPKGPAKKATLRYWQNVQNALALKRPNATPKHTLK